MKRLLIRPGAIGDFVVSLPAMECLRCEYLEVWAAPPNVPLALFANSARSIRSTGLDLLELDQADARLIDALAGFDSIVSWYGAGRAEFRAAVARLGLPFRFLPALPTENCGVHAADYYLEQVRAIAECRSDGVPRIPCPAGRADFVAIHPFSGSRRKCWPIDRFGELARRLALRMPVQWFAGPEDNLPGALRFDNLYDLACRLGQARIYIGNDSGPSHLAAAAGAPVVALFGASDPAVWAPRGPCVSIAAAPSMEAITVEEVERLVYDTLGSC